MIFHLVLYDCVDFQVDYQQGSYNNGASQVYNNGTSLLGTPGHITQETAGGPNSMLESFPHTGNCTLEASISNQLSAQTVTSLFDIVPGMESCQFEDHTGK